MSDKNIYQKINILIKQRIVLTDKPEVKYVRYMRSHNSGNIHGENLHILAVDLGN